MQATPLYWKKKKKRGQIWQEKSCKIQWLKVTLLNVQDL